METPTILCPCGAVLAHGVKLNSVRRNEIVGHRSQRSTANDVVAFLKEMTAT